MIKKKQPTPTTTTPTTPHTQKIKKLFTTMMRWAERNKRAHLRGQHKITEMMKDDLKIVIQYDHIADEKGVVSHAAMLHMNELYIKYNNR